MLAPLALNAAAFRCRVDKHHALRHTAANYAEAGVCEHALQSLGLTPPVPVPTLRPVLALDARAFEVLKRLEQLWKPFAFPVGKLLLGDGVQQLSGFGLAGCNIPEEGG